MTTQLPRSISALQGYLKILHSLITGLNTFLHSGSWWENQDGGQCTPGWMVDWPPPWPDSPVLCSILSFLANGVSQSDASGSLKSSVYLAHIFCHHYEHAPSWSTGGQETCGAVISGSDWDHPGLAKAIWLQTWARQAETSLNQPAKSWAKWMLVTLSHGVPESFVTQHCHGRDPWYNQDCL